MNPFTQLNEQLNLMIEEALSNEGGSIHINTADAEIIIQLSLLFIREGLFRKCGITL